MRAAVILYAHIATFEGGVTFIYLGQLWHIFWYWFCPELLLHFVGLGQSFWNAVSLLQQLLAVFSISTLHSLDKLKFCHSLCCSQMNI